MTHRRSNFILLSLFFSRILYHERNSLSKEPYPDIFCKRVSRVSTRRHASIDILSLEKRQRFETFSKGSNEFRSPLLRIFPRAIVHKSAGWKRDLAGPSSAKNSPPPRRRTLSLFSPRWPDKIADTYRFLSAPGIFFDSRSSRRRGFGERPRRKNATRMQQCWPDGLHVTGGRQSGKGSFLTARTCQHTLTYVPMSTTGYLRAPVSRCTLPPPYRCGKKESFQLNGTCRG